MRTGPDRRDAPSPDTAPARLGPAPPRPNHGSFSRHPHRGRRAYTSDGRLIGRPIIEPGTQPLALPTGVRGTVLLRVGATPRGFRPSATCRILGHDRNPDPPPCLLRRSHGDGEPPRRPQQLPPLPVVLGRRGVTAGTSRAATAASRFPERLQRRQRRRSARHQHDRAGPEAHALTSCAFYNSACSASAEKYVTEYWPATRSR